MKDLQNKLLENLKGYDFNELENLLNKTNLPEAREVILNAMEKYHEKQFYKWLENN